MRFAHPGGESGQSSVLGSFLFFILVIFVIFAINAGKIVTDEIHLQQTADLAAYAAAATQAEALNEMRKLNHANLEIAYRTRDRLYRESMKPPGESEWLCDDQTCGCEPTNETAERIIEDAELRISENLQRMRRINREYVDRAERSAQATAGAMWAGTEEKTRWVGKTDVVMKLRAREMKFHYGTWCTDRFTGQPVKGEVNTEHEFEVWLQKDDRQMKDTFAVVGVEDVTPDNPLLYTKMYAPVKCASGFGKGEGGRCRLGAYAAARPFYGKVGPNLGSMGDRDLYERAQTDHEPENAEGLGVQEPDAVRELVRRQGLIDDNQYYENYRVRLVGVFEGQNLESGKPWMEELQCPDPYDGAACVRVMRH